MERRLETLEALAASMEKKPWSAADQVGGSLTRSQGEG